MSQTVIVTFANISVPVVLSIQFLWCISSKTSGESNLKRGRIAAAHGRSIVFNRWRQCAPPSNTCFLGPTRVHNPNGISIRSAVFAGLTIDRQTDMYVTIGRICARSIAMRPIVNLLTSSGCRHQTTGVKGAASILSEVKIRRGKWLIFPGWSQRFNTVAGREEGHQLCKSYSSIFRSSPGDALSHVSPYVHKKFFSAVALIWCVGRSRPRMRTSVTSTRSKVKVKVTELLKFRKLHFSRSISSTILVSQNWWSIVIVWDLDYSLAESAFRISF